MPKRVKKTKCGGGWGVAKKMRGGGMPERGKEDKMRGLRKKFEGGYSGDGKEDKMWGVAKKN